MMKMILREEDTEGLVSLLGNRVLLMCSSYFYTGTLIGANAQDVKLEDAAIVYDTGPWDTPGFADAQNVGGVIYVRVSHIESYKEL